MKAITVINTWGDTDFNCLETHGTRCNSKVHSLCHKTSFRRIKIKRTWKNMRHPTSKSQRALHKNTEIFLME